MGAAELTSRALRQTRSRGDGHSRGLFARGGVGLSTAGGPRCGVHPVKRTPKVARKRAALQLRCWGDSLAFWQEFGRGPELGDVAWGAVERAAERLGYGDANAAAHADPTAIQECFSEAIEELETPE